MSNASLTNIKGMLIKLVERYLKGFKSKDIAWTCFNDQKVALSGKGYARGHVVHNARATNDYGDRSVAIYLINRHPNRYVNTFLKDSAPLDKDIYGLSEMIQWIWRTRIRNGESIKVVIPNDRMRNLLKRWLDGEFLLDAVTEKLKAA